MLKQYYLLSVPSIFAWGFLTEQEVSAIIMGFTILFLGHSKLRWNIYKRQYHQAVDFTSIVFTIVSIYMFLSYSHEALYKILRVIPFIGFPLLLVQIAGVRDEIPLSAFQYKLRKSSDTGQMINITPHYFLCTMFAITTKGGSTLGLFFVVILFTTFISLRRTKISSRTLYFCFLLTGLFFSISLIHSYLPAYNALLNEISKRVTIKHWRNPPYDSFTTSIGKIAKNKHSDEIRLRVKPNTSLNRGNPVYLVESIFDEYFLTGKWVSNTDGYQQLDKISESNRWRTTELIVRKQEIENPLRIIIKTEKDLFLMPTLSQTSSINSNDLVELSMNGYDNLKGEAKPGYVGYSAIATDRPQSSFTSLDLVVPKPYVRLLAETLKTQHIDPNMSDDEKITKVQAFLTNNFVYSYPLDETHVSNTLAAFLLKSKKGHCEHFATATALLLRQLGIPSRYVVGYLVSEWSPLESQYIVRDRHAHAWTLAYVNGTWRRLDFTPPNWQTEESSYFHNSNLAGDVLAYLSYLGNTWQSSIAESDKTVLLFLVPPLLIVLTFRLIRSPQVVKIEPPSTSPQRPELNNLGIENLIEDLERHDIRRLKHETLGVMFKRASKIGVPLELLEKLTSAYYEVRFSQKITEEQKESLRLISLDIRKLVPKKLSVFSKFRPR
tara:strand:- start:921 stop:2912 length:1992 start_codon:yes stop_codon:yes gene_type:complete